MYDDLSRREPTFRHNSPAGFSDQEDYVWDMVSKAAGAYLKLTDTEPGHPMEREEVCHAFHQIQGLLALRPTVRRIGDAYGTNGAPEGGSGTTQ